MRRRDWMELPKNRFLRGVYLLVQRYLRHNVGMQGAALAFYLLFSFFTTWFSNPSTWFYLALSLLICLWLAWPLRKDRG